MTKPEIPASLPGAPAASPSAFVQQPFPVNAAASIPPTRPPGRAAAGAPAYVDPYLFETGYYASRAEYEELARTAHTRIQLRAEVENARPKKRP